ncbi:MAG TPA: M20/M25/M40 family metallo-hydrolase [Firmicutes bacterium]|nr:M20/M25/M40 family metallo-hydrolase [Bacillota bacterium]
MHFPGEDVHQLAKQHLISLIRLDTTNPPGNEIRAARYLEEVLEREGIWHQVFEPAPGRGSIVARLKGNGEAAPLLLMAHLDVVPARAEEWQHPPFAGEEADGCIWGRGALDCKDLVAGWTTILVALKRSGAQLRRDVILAATADEEAGGNWGMGWLCREHPELIQAEAALNEGGGASFQIGSGGIGPRPTLFACQTSEKGVCWLRLTARGPAGHGSVPLPGNAVTHLARAVARLGSTSLPMHLTPTVEAMLASFVQAGGPEVGRRLQQIVANGGQREQFDKLLPPEKAASLAAALRNTVSPTVLKAGDKTNVIPSLATAELDGRMLPGFTPEAFLAEVRQVLGEDAGQVTLEPVMTANPSESPFSGSLVTSLQEAIARRGGVLAPFMSTGMTDGRFVREQGIPVYGFWPQLPHVPLHLTHGTDERIPEDSFRFALEVMWDAVTSFCC